MMQFQMQQQLMTKMMIMMGGMNVLVQPGVNTQQTNIPYIPLMQSPNDNNNGMMESIWKVAKREMKKISLIVKIIRSIVYGN